MDAILSLPGIILTAFAFSQAVHLAVVLLGPK